MKKTVISGFVITSFAVYSLLSRLGQDTKNAVASPGSQGQGLSGLGSVMATPTSSAAVSYKNGSYTGDVADAYYGNIQVKVIISNNKIADVQFLQYPNDRDRSVIINNYAMPYLKQEAIQSQNASVDIVSGATDTSQAFIQSLSSALNQAS